MTLKQDFWRKLRDLDKVIQEAETIGELPPGSYESWESDTLDITAQLLVEWKTSWLENGQPVRMTKDLRKKS